MTLDDVIRDACGKVGIKPPRRFAPPGRWARCDTQERNGKGDGEVMIHDDEKGVSVVNWQRGERHKQRLTDPSGNPLPIRRDPVKERQRREEEAEVAKTCERIVRACRADVHPYLARKGFPDERGLVCDDLASLLPPGDLGAAMAYSIPGEGPLLIIPGRIGNRLSTVQMIAADGAKKNLSRGIMSGAAHRIATGRETWVAEGIATALTVRAALRLLGRPATVLSAFAASNVGKVAESLPGSIIAADHDAPQPNMSGMGAGEFFARKAGRVWVMPPTEGEDFNDWHQREGLRAVAVHMRGVGLA